MWVFTQDGFISAVDNGHVPGKLTVRARDRESLSLLSDITGEEIHKMQQTDYPYRVFVTREQFSNFLTAHVETMDYRNFKSRVYATRGDKYAHACSDVWGTMLSMTDEEAQGIGLYS